MLASDLIEAEERWIFYDDEETEILVEISNALYTELLIEVIEEVYENLWLHYYFIIDILHITILTEKS